MVVGLVFLWLKKRNTEVRLLLMLLLLLFCTCGRCIPEGFEKRKWEEKLTNKYDTQSVQSNAGKQSLNRTALKRGNSIEIF